jgi:predicted nucleic acid-binding Zn ribbon protein
MALSSEQRVERARTAAAARWSKTDWPNMEIADALTAIAELREELERGSKIVQQRITHPKVLHCFVCDKIIPDGKWVQNKFTRNVSTGMIDTIYYCSARCVSLESEQKRKQIEASIRPETTSAQPK